MGITSFLSAAAPIISGLSSAFGAKTQNDANLAISQKQMDFQERMSSSSYQRGMKDMRLAGLNPILAYKMGGASTPTGASIQAQNVAGPAAASAASTYQMIQSTKNLAADTMLKGATTRKTIAEARRMERHGDSIFGRQGDTAEKWGTRAWDYISELMGWSAKSNRGTTVTRLPRPKNRGQERSMFRQAIKRLRRPSPTERAWRSKPPPFPYR